MRKITLKRLTGLAVLAVTASLAIAPAAALAQDALSNPTNAQYQPKSQVAGIAETGSQAPAAANTSGSGLNSNVGSLPFTGLDVMVLAIVAAALMGTGLTLRRLSRPKTPGA